MRTLAAPGVALLALVFATACDKQAPDKDAGKKADAAETKDTKKADADPGDTEKSANFADPQAEPPRAPEGALTLRKPWLYVQTCAEPNLCPDLLQPAGDKHCRELKLGGHVNWRLPSKDEVLRFGGVEGLEARAGYHWTRTPDEENMAMAWIVDPEDTQVARPTTIPRERKPFRIRCVKEP